MQLGLHALEIGARADRSMIDAVACAADDAGFATLWAGEHVVMVDRHTSRYPYSEDGVIAIPPQADWLDPMIALSFAAASSSRITVATGVLLLPEHNPVVVAKQAASLDRLSGGRLTLGVGVGWSREEFAALGVPFQDRVGRTAEYVAAMRTLWRDDLASFTGEFVRFDSVRVNPKPVRDRRVPVMVGGNSDAALRRVAAWADGWYGFNLDGVGAVRERVGTLDRLCAESGRNRDELRLSVALRCPQPCDVDALAELGIDELVLVETPPEAADAAQTGFRRWQKDGCPQCGLGRLPVDMSEADTLFPRELTDLDDEVRSVPPPPAPEVPSPYAFRLADPDADAEKIADWMRRPHLLRAWDAAWPASRWYRYLQAQLEGDYSRPYIGSLDGLDYGYLELYRAAKDLISTLYESDPYDLGIHAATAEPKFVGLGNAQLLLPHFVASVLNAEPQCRRIVFSPDYRSRGTRRFCENGGCTFLGEHDLPDRRVALYVLPRTLDDVPGLSS